MMNNVKYELVDAETGNVYEVFIPQHEALVLDYDKDRRFRMLNCLKEKNIAPAFHWDLSYVVASPQSEGPSSSGSDHSSQPLATSSLIIRPPRATGKTGGIWKDDNKTKVFLQECIKRKSQMQSRTIEEATYQSISDSLYILNINYSPGQLRAKMKSLRRQHTEAKGKGLHGGSKWKFFNLMEALFPHDTPQLVIEDDCAKGLEHFDSIQSVKDVINEESVNGSEVSFHLHLSTLPGSADDSALLHSLEGNQVALHISENVQKNQRHEIDEFQYEESSDFLNIHDSTLGNSPWHDRTPVATSEEPNIPSQDLLALNNSAFVPCLKDKSVENRLLQRSRGPIATTSDQSVHIPPVGRNSGHVTASGTQIDDALKWLLLPVHNG